MKTVLNIEYSRFSRKNVKLSYSSHSTPFHTAIKRFKGYCCESGMLLYKSKVIWKYAYKSLSVPFIPFQSLSVLFSPFHSLSVLFSPFHSLSVPFSPFRSFHSLSVPFSPFSPFHSLSAPFSLFFYSKMSNLSFSRQCRQLMNTFYRNMFV